MRTRTVIVYILLVGGPVAILAGILGLGPGLAVRGHAQWPAPAVAGNVAAVSAATLIAQIAVILAVARLTGSVFARLGQPRVVGEMVAGILLGPTVLGAVWPAGFETLFPAGSLAGLGALSRLGLVLFMFLVGLGLDTGSLRQHARTAVVGSHVSIVAPFVLGAALALHLFERLAPPTVSFTGFALFIGAAMGITAFPVLARILQERGLVRTPLGTVALASAAIDDVTAWCILSGIVGYVRYGSGATALWLTIAGAAVFGALMVWAVRPALRFFERRADLAGGLSTDAVAVFVLVALAAALATEVIGVHALFGAFLAGVVVPRSPSLAVAIRSRLEPVTVIILLPIFFATTGLQTTIDVVTRPDLLVDTLLIVAVAVVGKLGGASIAARTTGMSWRESASYGALMNTRGLMELVILEIGLDIGAISAPLFSMMVLMAIVTTMMTTPLLSTLHAGHAPSATGGKG